MGKKELEIYIGGVPPGVRVGIFDERVKRGEPSREIFLEEVGPDSCIHRRIDPSYGGAPVEVVIRCAGYLPYEYLDTIEEGIGLFHAAHLRVDTVYEGIKHNIPSGWNATDEHRKAEREVQRLYRKLRKDNPRERNVKLALDFGAPVVCAGIGFAVDPLIGTVVGRVMVESGVWMS